MLTLQDIGIEFGGKWLLRNATFQFTPGEKTGLIGRNGAGKSTLLKMIAGRMTPTEGQVQIAGGCRVAYFHQDLMSFESDASIFHLAREAFADVLSVKDEIDQLLHKTEEGNAVPEDWDRLVHLQDEFETKDGHRIDAKVHSILAGLGFPAEKHHSPFHTFSGGWRMRVLLAKMLLVEPEILLLDEPTNHLDLPSIQWLENYLKTYSGICVLVSHDRFFMDRMADKIIEITLQQLHTYGGNYSYFLKEKALRADQHKKSYDNQQKQIEDQEKFINRFRAKASKAKQVQSKIKLLDKVERILPPEEDSANVSFRFNPKTKSGREVLTLTDISKSYGDLHILKDSSAILNRSDKIALIGANGLGKSTLLRILADREPFEGGRKLGHQVEESFFAQHQLEALNLDRTILEEVAYDAPSYTEQELRSVLGCFMFSGEDAEKRIRVLSGGERSRVALAKTLLSQANFLLLDEPTNHLDIQSIQILSEAMRSFDGTYVVVSHDRHFLNGVANKIWYIEDLQLKEYPGTYVEFAEWKARQELALQADSSPAVPKKQETESESDKKQLSFKEQKQLKNRLKKLEREQEVIEEQIATLEEEIQNLEEAMADPNNARNFEALEKTQTLYHNKKTSLDAITVTWEAIVLEIEQLSAES
ncbi:MAG: ABC-F family ATP-binding cassette domain-containing protein [Bacteroidia bacterium]|nr:ABC-F family ATP-binding cassette domain-containing protein [Bacteroidia bacterium]